MKQHCIVGSGIVGLFTAYYLLESGISNISIIDKNNGEDGCSFGNAGMIVPSHFVPLAAPGIMSQGLKWMLDSKSPFYLKPRLDMDLIRWIYAFYKSSNQKKLNISMPLLRDLGNYSRSLYAALNSEMDLDVKSSGLMLYCKSEHTLEEEYHTATKANELGIETKKYTPTELKKLEPEIDLDVMGAVFYPNDALVEPRAMHETLTSYLKSKGVKFILNTEVKKITVENNMVNSIDAGYDLACESLTIAGGSWSQEIAKQLGIYLPLQAGKGYSFVSKNSPVVRHPSILVEARVAISPFNASMLRFGGTMEISGINSKINLNRVEGIAEAIPKYFRNFEKPKPENIWYGLRPCSPDGLPYIGKVPHLKNAYINSGHAMMGLSLAPASGKLLANAMINSSQPFNIEGLNVMRFA